MKKSVCFVIPVLNEENNISLLYRRLSEVVAELPYQFTFLFIDDGSTDNSLKVIQTLSKIDTRVFFIELSRNFGHQYALKAGLDTVRCDCAITMDCDLQHPPEIVLQLLKNWEVGYDVVYTRRKENKNLPWIKRKTSVLFYLLINYLSDLQLDAGTADFRLMNKASLNAFATLNESELFIRGLVKWAGFKQTFVDYTPNERHDGISKYSFRNMLSFAFRAITSFSVKPLRMIAYLGMILFLISLILVPYTLASYFLGVAVSGWTSLMTIVIFFGSLQLLMIGIIGLYISKLVIQSKHRPLYFIRETNYVATNE
jgi:glycosyltransferase involved in cell wall biosynthesis